MFHKLNDIKSDTNRLFSQSTIDTVEPSDEQVASRQQQQSCLINQLCNNKSREETKSHSKTRNNTNQYSFSQHPNQQVHSSSQDSSSNSNTSKINTVFSNMNEHTTRTSKSIARSTSSTQLNQSQDHHHHLHNQISSPPAISSPISSKQQAFHCETTTLSPSSKYITNCSNKQHRNPSNINLASTNTALHPSQMRDVTNKAGSSATSRLQHPDHQLDKDNDEVVTTLIRQELETDTNGFFDTQELETLTSLEKDNLPAELSFLIRQQAYCLAKMNYLDRQIRELKESKQQQQQQIASSTYNTHQPFRNHPHHPQQHQYQIQQTSSNLVNRNFPHHSGRVNNPAELVSSNNVKSNTNCAILKNGNFIPSDDSGGEYSRATTSDDDELSSLLDQIAKSVKPDRLTTQQNTSIHQPHQLQQRASNFNVINPQPQPYAIINPNQLPGFVMSFPFVPVAHPASSISSTVLPGVHFQPEPRYNQYYEDLYVQNNSTSTMNRQNSAPTKQPNFDTSISAIEQLVSQKEKRQVKSQLKSADNWLKMRASGGLCNLNDTNFSNVSNSKGPLSDDISGGERNLPGSSSSATLANENLDIVNEEIRDQ